MANNLNIIRALRQHNLMSAGALYALGHDALAERAEYVFPAAVAAAEGYRQIDAAITRDFGSALWDDEPERPVPAERAEELEFALKWRDQTEAALAEIVPAIEAIIATLYNDATITAEEGQCL